MAFGRQLHQAKGQFRTPLCKVVGVHKSVVTVLKLRFCPKSLRITLTGQYMIVILGCQCEVVIKVKVLKSELRRRSSTVRTDIENNGNTHYPFILGHSIANIHSLLEAGAFSGFKAEEIDIEILFNAQKQDLDGMSKIEDLHPVSRFAIQIAKVQNSSFFLGLKLRDSPLYVTARACEATSVSEYTNDEIQPLATLFTFAVAPEAFYISVKLGVIAYQYNEYAWSSDLLIAETNEERNASIWSTISNPPTNVIAKMKSKSEVEKEKCLLEATKTPYLKPRGEGFQEQLSGLIFRKDPVFVKCLILRNYHRFYMLCDASTENVQRSRLGKAGSFHYLNQSNRYELEG
uniref:Uncharacterized protein n=1 Tax=Vitis vinifera TaxID=29760 RepID=A5AVG4_VITVI|nr:hypothetical protein VITISV_026854 [Vitis vinifera]